jgi:hypothetical protein
MGLTERRFQNISAQAICLSSWRNSDESLPLSNRLGARSNPAMIDVVYGPRKRWLLPLRHMLLMFPFRGHSI